MKVYSLFKKFIVSSGFLAVIPAVLFLILLPPLSTKYILSVEKTPRFKDQIVYEDLNSDTISERITSGKTAYNYISVQDLDLRYYDQWNLSDSVNTSISGIFFGNYDHDIYKEIYIFTHKEDSLFLNVNELLEQGGTKLERIFITKIGYANGRSFSAVEPAGFYDNNGDGRDEIYFVISSAFRLGPRRVVSFDMVNRKLYTGPFTPAIIHNPEMKDVDGDQKPEIFGIMSASGNYPANVPFSDSSTWFMIYNDRLKFEFKPVEFPGFVNALETSAYSNKYFNGYVLSHYVGGTGTTVLNSQIMIYSHDGKLITYRLNSDIGISGRPRLFIINHNNTDRIYIISNNSIFELNGKLELVRTVNLPFTKQLEYNQTDINGDGQEEFLVYSEDDERLVVFNGELKKIAELILKTSGKEWKFSPYYTKDQVYKLFLRSGNEGYLLQLNRNRYYYLDHLVHPLIYLLCFLFIYFIKRINTYQVIHRESLKRKLVTLQLQGIKAQLDPHFTFNSLNTVASLIYLENSQAAYDYLIKFTKLLRRIVNDAENIYRTLEEEMEFVNLYLELEKLRFGEKFNYEIEVGNGISRQEKVPKMVLQTFAENAVKHGIMTSTDGGLLKISIIKENSYLKLTIEDNGIGRKASAGQSTSTGKGLKITGEFYNILNQINKNPIKYLVTDLHNESGKPVGTRVEVWVPLEEAQDKR
jgi:hypothetical protein